MQWSAGSGAAGRSIRAPIIVTNPRAIAIIPARGGSKGLPRKNILPVAGKPLVAWTIEAAKASRHIAQVYVSTDSVEIADVARRWGAEVIDRPTDISGDKASSEAAILHALDVLESRDIHPRLTVFLQCTSPLTETEDIDGVVEKLLSEGADSALSVAPFFHFLWKPTPEGGVGINHDKRVRLRRQDMEPQFLENGAVYVFKTEGFRQSKHRFFGKTVLHALEAEKVLEIDDPVEMEIAEVRLRHRVRKNGIASLPEHPAALVFDFDGVFTDNRVIVDETGVESVVCDRGDGLGLGRLKAAGFPMLILSKERNPVVAARGAKVGIEVIQGIDEKLTTMLAWLARQGVDPRDAIYVGNDLNDVECLAAVGCGVAVADAYEPAKRAAKVVLMQAGGRGAIREIVDMVQTQLERNGNGSRN